jgi:hypothetical protein
VGIAQFAEIHAGCAVARRLLAALRLALFRLVSFPLLRRLAALPLLLLAGCVAGAGGAPDLADQEQAGNIQVCDGQTLSELERAKTLSDACKADVAAYLPSPSNDFAGRIVVLGQEQHDDGSLRVFVAGTDAGGVPLGGAAFGAARLSLQGAGSALVDSGVTPVATAFANLSEDVLSLEIVNDYSASMSLADLQAVEQIEDDLITALPPIFEGEVTLFSSQVRVKQAFTTDRAALLDAVECDQAFDRELTALYDGMGNGLDSLTSRSRPARVLLVSTDGLENASVAYKKADILKTIAADGVVVVMLGALFADVKELETLAGSRGVYVYTPLYADMQSQVQALIAALANGVALDIPADIAQNRPLRADGTKTPFVLEIAGESVTIE